MQCHSTNWTGALDRTLRTDVSPWAMTLGALPALGHWATRTVWEGIRAGALGRAGTCQLFLSLWLLGPVVSIYSQGWKPRLGPKRKDMDQLVV